MRGPVEVVEHDVTQGSIVEVKLHIVAKCVPLGTTIDLALFEPLE